jgi:uncharacterized protein YeaO (DUF488 family)
MIQREKILAQLQQKRDRFAAFDQAFNDEAARYQDALRALANLSRAELIARLQSAEPAAGALPTAEFDQARNLCQPFPPSWSNHQEARAWACDVLLDHSTCAVDGSQIKPALDFSIPVAAVQVAWFVNHHTRAGHYTKEARFEVLAPEDVLVEFNGDLLVSEQQVNLRRFELEVEVLCELEQLAARGVDAPLSIALFDSSLVISFADRLQAEMQQKHIEAMLRLLRCSERTGVPVVGYIDTSRARDLTNMLAHCFTDLRPAETVHDAQLVNHLLAWGARTPLFICARGSADRKQQGVLAQFAEFARGIGFVYLKAGSYAPPARLEIPLWVYERGLLDEVIDLVRAELIVGNGYPYVISAADAAAVISAHDREAFYAIFQHFAAEQGIELKVAPKAASKARRR